MRPERGEEIEKASVEGVPVPKARGPDAPRLDARALVDFLLRQNLIEPADVVTGGLTVTDRSRRNVNWLVRFDGGGYFVKMPRDDTTHRTLLSEARTLEGLRAATGRRWLQSCLPSIAFADPERALLVFDLAGDGVTAGEHVSRWRRVSRRRFRGLGRALGELHEIPVSESTPLGGGPWVLSFHEPPMAFLEIASEGNLQLLAAVQGRSEIGEALTGLAEEWRPVTVTHGDLKSENLVVADSSRLIIVDWELARSGDPAWDIGSVFADGLAMWLSSMSAGPRSAIDDLPSSARLPLARVQPAMRDFWSAYMERRGLPAAEVRSLLDRSVRSAGARLLQTAHEQLQNTLELTSLSVLTLQLATNVLLKPREAAAQLFGLT